MTEVDLESTQVTLRTWQVLERCAASHPGIRWQNEALAWHQRIAGVVLLLDSLGFLVDGLKDGQYAVIRQKL